MSLCRVELDVDGDEKAADGTGKRRTICIGPNEKCGAKYPEVGSAVLPSGCSPSKCLYDKSNAGLTCQQLDTSSNCAMCNSNAAACCPCNTECYQWDSKQNAWCECYPLNGIPTCRTGLKPVGNSDKQCVPTGSPRYCSGRCDRLCRKWGSSKCPFADPCPTGADCPLGPGPNDCTHVGPKVDASSPYYWCPASGRAALAAAADAAVLDARAAQAELEQERKAAAIEDAGAEEEAAKAAAAAFAAAGDASATGTASAGTAAVDAGTPAARRKRRLSLRR
eukprot:scaffold1.g5725.t1